MLCRPCRGVRFQGDNWQARTKRHGKELSLGLYNTAEEAVSGLRTGCLRES